MRRASLDPSGHFYCDNQFSPVEHVIPFRCIAGQTMELSEGNRPFSTPRAYDHICIHRRERDRHVRRMGGDASVGPSEDSVSAIEAPQRRTAGAGPTLIAREVIAVTEVG